ncbi:MAG: AAA family ATPase [Lachnospiraceae bacterium]|nr:AAA family ATPase [Lachnospiraceae bacterium]
MSENSCSGIKLYSDVCTTQVQWLWYPFIALGKLTLLQGDPGDGKSTMMLNLIAAISNGGTTPDGQAFGRPHRVIYQCSEDGVEDTIKPRLESCGANCGNVAFIDEETHGGLTLDDERIRQSIASFRPWLVVIDPVQAYVGNDADLQVAGRARKLMHRLGIWASTYDCAIVLIGHLNKKEGSKNIYRSLGSIDVVAAVRSVLQVERDEEDEDIRIVRQIKNSLAPVGDEIRYEIRPGSGFKWLVSSTSSCAVHVPDRNAIPQFETKQDKAVFLIKKYLTDGDMRSKEIFMRLHDEGIGRRTAQMAKQEMGVQSYRTRQEWYWTLGQKQNTE